MRAALACFLAAAIIPRAFAAPDSLVQDLEHRLAAGGVEKVNAYLGNQGSSAMDSLNHRVANCELQAVSLAIRLSRGSDVQAVTAHGESLRAAVGHCTGFVLALATPQEIPKFCRSVESWTITQTARELRRRIAAIESDAVLRASPRGKACRAAYQDEFHNTRVVLRRMAPDPARQGK